MTMREYVTFRICDQLFGLSVTEIHDVFRPAKMTPVPLSSSKASTTAEWTSRTGRF